MRSKSSPTSRPSSSSPSAAFPQIGEPVWARVDSFPWWPARVVSRDQLSLAPDEPEPRVRLGQMLVQFFNDNNRFEVMDRRNVKLYYQDNEQKVNKSYDGPYAYDLAEAVKEIRAYAKDIGWDKKHPVGAKRVSHDTPVDGPADRTVGAAPTPRDKGKSRLVTAALDAPMVVDDGPAHPGLPAVDDVPGTMDADDVEFVFKNNSTDVVQAPQIADRGIDDEIDIICLDRDSPNHGFGGATQAEQETLPAAHVRGTRDARVGATGKVLPLKTHDAMDGVVTAGQAVATTPVRSQSGRGAEAVANRSAEVVTPRKEPHSDDTSTESLPINESPAKEDSPAAADGENRGDEAPAGKRKISQVEGRETRAPMSGAGVKTGTNASTPNKRIKKSPKQQPSTAKTGTKNTTSGQKSKSTGPTSRGDGARVGDKDLRGGRSKKSSKVSTGDKNGSGSKIPSTEKGVRSALRSRDEKIAAMQTRIKELESPDAGKTGQQLVRQGLELIQPAKDMLKAAQDMLKDAREMIKEGQEMLKNSL